MTDPVTTDLRTLPGIGAAFAADLRTAGVRDAEAFRALGPAEAASRLAERGLRDVARLGISWRSHSARTGRRRP